MGHEASLVYRWNLGSNRSRTPHERGASRRTSGTGATAGESRGITAFGLHAVFGSRKSRQSFEAGIASTESALSERSRCESDARKSADGANGKIDARRSGEDVRASERQGRREAEWNRAEEHVDEQGA